MTVNKLQVRSVSADDSRMLFDWRNDPQTRAVSLSTDQVEWSEHKRWFEAALKNPLRIIYICEGLLDAAIAAPIGMVRFDVSGSENSAEVSINLNPEARGHGFGSAALAESLRRFESEHPHVTTTTARIREDNLPSVAVFEKVGYTLITRENGVGEYLRKSVDR